MYKLLIICTLFSIFVVNMSGQSTELAGRENPQLNLERAQYLHRFALECMDQEYPNKTGHVLGSDTSAYKPRIIHPAFYGCFDWHSSVHGHWTLVQLLKHFPEMDTATEIRTKLLQHITGPNIIQEAAYFSDPHNRNFERTYGWAWAFKLAQALHTWDDPDAAIMSRNLQPLIDTLEQRLHEFLPKLNYPIRVGEHTNTAFALSLTYDYARSLRRDTLLELIGERSRDYYLNDRNCPISWEPSGFDFLSPCLQEASLMAKVLPDQEFVDWLNAFLPGLTDYPEKSLPVRRQDLGIG